MTNSQLLYWCEYINIYDKIETNVILNNKQYYTNGKLTRLVRRKYIYNIPL
jgi:hypothetical protein